MISWATWKMRRLSKRIHLNRSLTFICCGIWVIIHRKVWSRLKFRSTMLYAQNVIWALSIFLMAESLPLFLDRYKDIISQLLRIIIRIMRLSPAIRQSPIRLHLWQAIQWSLLCWSWAAQYGWWSKRSKKRRNKSIKGLSYYQNSEWSCSLFFFLNFMYEPYRYRKCPLQKRQPLSDCLLESIFVFSPSALPLLLGFSSAIPS